MTIQYRQIESFEESMAIDLVLKVFTEFVAPQYSREGVAEFKKYANATALADRLKNGNIVLLAEYRKDIIGVIEIRGNNHIALLYVEKYYQRKGIARELIRRCIELCKAGKSGINLLTVNASPNAADAYKKIGFKPISAEKEVNGIRFVPMELSI